MLKKINFSFKKRKHHDFTSEVDYEFLLQQLMLELSHNEDNHYSASQEYNYEEEYYEKASQDDQESYSASQREEEASQHRKGRKNSQNESNYKEEVEIPDFITTLGFVNIPEDFEIVKSRYRSLSQSVHPDKPSGNHEDFVRFNKAYKEAKEFYGAN